MHQRIAPAQMRQFMRKHGPDLRMTHRVGTVGRQQERRMHHARQNRPCNAVMQLCYGGKQV